MTHDHDLLPKCLYLAGPITGHDDYNEPLFRRAAAELRSVGYRVFVPHELSKKDRTLAWSLYMRWALRALMDCDELVLLPGWELSRGARVELFVATALEMPRWEWTITGLVTLRERACAS
jgi:hypothetical protein